jgi:3',5'-cyclic AMP phosphodiesterase CpdA
MLTIAQITDLHITTPEDLLNKNRNEERLRQVLASIHALHPRPVAIFASGDLVDRATLAEYVELRESLKEVEIPIYFGMGNHDARAPFLEVFSGPFAPVDENGFVQYAMEFEDLRVVMCDTLDEGRANGAFCADRAAWLSRTLDARPEMPTLLMLHHPPVASGIAWMDPPEDSGWIASLDKVLRGRPQIRTIAAGHLHRGFVTTFAGHLLVASPATSIQLTLNLTPVDMAHADGREILVSEPPAYVLHMWDRGELVSHTVMAGDFPAAVYYTKPFIKGAA